MPHQEGAPSCAPTIVLIVVVIATIVTILFAIVFRTIPLTLLAAACVCYLLGRKIWSR